MPKLTPAVAAQEAAAIARLWDPAAREVRHVRDGENSVWAFETRSGHILRITSEGHRTREQLEAELLFVEHVVEHGVHAAQPVASPTGEKVADVSRLVSGAGRTYATVFQRLEGRHFEFYSDDIGPQLFSQWGRTMAHLHSRAETFVAPGGLRRPDWQQDEVAGCPVVDLQLDDRLTEIRNELVGWLGSEAAKPAHYGMVHGDFERTNFVLKDGAIGILDFDDCCHHWFCWDIVCALWAFRNATRDDRAAFLGWFLEGYSAVREPDEVMLARFSDLIRLRSLGLLLYRRRSGTPAADEWMQRTRSWLDSAWSW